MRILMVTAEMAPFAQVGGLSQVVPHLSRALIKRGHDVRVFMPKYGSIDEKQFPLKYIAKHLAIPTGHPGTSKQLPAELICNVKQSPKSGTPTTYFLENREYYELRSNVYGYKDDVVRFFLLCQGTLEWLKQQAESNGWLPEIVHCHDWHTAYLIEEAKRHPRYQKLFKKIKLLFTIHNQKYQGPTNYLQLPETERDTGRPRLRPFFDPQLALQNPFMRAVIHADWVNTVSESYMQEIQTPEYCEGLYNTMRRYRHKLSGILNGIDLKDFDPETDPNIAHYFSWRRLEHRHKNKAILQKLFHLPLEDQRPVIVYVGRLSAQKGIDLLIQAIPHLVRHTDCQVIIMGLGDEAYHTELRRLQAEYPDRVAIYLYKDFTLPRKIFAGADMILIPSRFEPAGIVPMEAMRYGCVPIVTRTGGLVESVTDFSLTDQRGRGFSFEPKQLWGFFAAIIRALVIYENPKLWQKLIRNGMRAEFSWRKAAGKYDQLYRAMVR